MQSDIPSEIPSASPDPSLIPSTIPEQTAPSFQCKICGQTFTNQPDLEQHMIVAHKEEAGGAGGSQVSQSSPPAGVG